MLDAFIIERIRRDQERQREQSRQQPLRIERMPYERPDAREREREHESEQEPGRGSTVVDYRI